MAHALRLSHTTAFIHISQTKNSMSTAKEANYVRYSDDVEVKQPNEDELSQKISDSMSRVNKMMFGQYRHAIRDAHAKSHGVIKAELQVYYNLPEHLAQGLFKTPKTYGAVIRYSTSHPAIEPDKKSFQRGMAIKVMGVEGDKFLPESSDASTQDFLLVNYPVIPTGTVETYLDFQEQLEKASHGPEFMQNLQNHMQVVTRKYKQLIGKEDDPNVFGLPGSNLLGDVYFSMAAIRFGDYVAKISVAPLSENLKALHEKSMDKEMKEDPDNFLTTIVSDFFKTQGGEYELRAQLCTDLKKMPVEDGSVQWSEDESPYQPIAKLIIKPQDTFSDARRVYGDDVLSFNPFHCLPEHRPLGNIMRVRRLVYEASSKFRHEKNVQPRVEPGSVDEIPD